MKKSIPSSINKWRKGIDKVFEIAFKGFPIKKPRSVTVEMLERLVYSGAACYNIVRNTKGVSFSNEDAISGSEKYFLKRDEIPTDSMVIAAYLWAHEINQDITFSEGIKIFNSLELRLGKVR